MKVSLPKNDLKTLVPGFPTEGSSATGGHPLVVRRVSAEDRARLRSFSVKNGEASWLQANFFKKDASWPRELYVKVLGCKGLAPPTAPDTYQAPDGSTTTTASNSTAPSVSYVTAAGVTGSAIFGAVTSPGRARIGTGDIVFNNGIPEGSNGVADAEEAHRDGERDRQLQEPDGELEPSGRESGSRFGSLDVGVGDLGVGSLRRAGTWNAGGSIGRELSKFGTEEYDSDEEEDERFRGRSEKVHNLPERELDWLVRVTNTTTGNDLYTRSARGDMDPSFGEAFVVPCQGPRDAVVLGVYGGVGISGGGTVGSVHVDDSTLVGEAVISLDSRFMGGNSTLLCKLSDSRGRMRGFIRIETFWVDEAKPRREAGDFYYKVLYSGGVSLRELPFSESPKTLHVMRPGEVFRACERQQHAGDDDVFVRVSASTDRWTRGGWCFETLQDKDGQRHNILERVSSPKREHGKFFFRVCAPSGVRLHSRPNRNSPLREVIPVDELLEASEIYTPAGSLVSFVTVDLDRGFFIIKNGDKVLRSEEGVVALEAVDHPEGVLVSSQGTGDGVPPPPPPHDPQSPPTEIPTEVPTAGAGAGPVEANGDSSTPSSSEALAASTAASGSERSSSRGGSVPPELAAVEAAAAARAVKERIYRGRASTGAPASLTPDITSETVGVVKAKEAFHGTAEVVKRYEGLGEVAFIRRASDGLWVRANRPGIMLLELIMDSVEAGAFTYRVSHENGVVVRTAPGLDAPIERPLRILPVTKLINVCERLVRAEDVISLSRPPVFLRLAGNDGWVFDRRGHTMVCEDVTEKARIATANAIATEAMRLAGLR